MLIFLVSGFCASHYVAENNAKNNYYIEESNRAFSLLIRLYKIG